MGQRTTQQNHMNKNRTIIFAALTAIMIPLALQGQNHSPPAAPLETLPDPSLTPGAVRTPSATEVCNDPSTEQYRNWSRERDDRILEEYGLPPGPHPDYEIDHLIPLDLGGADEDANLWPEPRASIVPYAVSAEAKDKLEWRMADMVCDSLAGGAHYPCLARAGIDL